MSLLALLKADAARQLHFAGVEASEVGGWRLVRMLPSPRFVPVVLFRLSSWCAGHRIRPIGRILSMMNFVLFGLEIGMDCEIGPGLYFPHTSGTVLGAHRIGANAVIYHNVTVGAKTPDLAYDSSKRPTIGDDAFLGAGCKVLGGIELGDGVIVGANAVVTRSMPGSCLVAGIPAQIVKSA